MSGGTMKTIVLIPSFNECASLMRLLPKINVPLVVIDDGSNDGTVDYLKSHNFTYLSKTQNAGVSKAIADGVIYAYDRGFENVITLDADGQHDPRHLDAFFQALHSSDFVYGNRFTNLSNVPSAKVASNMFASILTLVALGVFVPDVSCGFRGFKTIDFINSFNEVDAYQFIYTSLFESIVQKKRLSAVGIEPIYYINTLLCTRRIEILSLCEAISRFTSININGFDRLNNNILQRKDAQIEIRKCMFHFFYLQQKDSYIIQCNLKDALSYYGKELYNV